MYNFKEFSQEIIASVKEILVEKYGRADMTVQRKLKNNVELTAVVCDVSGAEKVGVVPTFYLEPLYAYYQQGAETEELLADLKVKLIDAIEDRERIDRIARNMLGNTDGIVFQLMHTKQNEELLEQLPHREFHNLSIVYLGIGNYDGRESLSFLINHHIAECMGLNESELYELAYENTKRISKPHIVPLQSVIKEMIKRGRKAVDLEALDGQVDETKLPMYVISNRYMDKGAANVLYTDKLYELAVKLDADLYLIPVSVNEMIAVPSDGPEIEQLLETLYEYNQEQPLDERLSNDIYRYARSTQSIVQETDSAHKTLEDENQNVDMNLTMH